MSIGHQHVPVVIIGAGPAGLTLAHHLEKDYLILELSDRVGGLCSSFEFAGAVFDIGGHSFHTGSPQVQEYVDTVCDYGMFYQQRNATVAHEGMLIPYPFQQNFRAIGNPELTARCEIAEGKGFGDKPENFHDYLIWKFGKGISDAFMIPYNRKIWGLDLRQMSTEWTSERIAGADKGSFDTQGGKRTALQSDTTVGYPKVGGFDQIFLSIAKRLNREKILFNTTHGFIKPAHKTIGVWTGNSSTEITYDVLVNTSPIDKFFDSVMMLAPTHRRRLKQLRKLALQVDFFSALPMKETPQRIYVADKSVPAHKVAFNHLSSRSLMQRDRQAIMMETSFSSTKPLDPNTHLKNRQWLVDMGFIDPVDALSTTAIVDYAYPIYTHDRVSIISSTLQLLREYDIYSIGRFGGWQYWNSDQVMAQAINVAKNINQWKLKGRKLQYV